MLGSATKAKSLVIVSRVVDPHWNLACCSLLHRDFARHKHLERLLFLCRAPPTGIVLLGRHSNEAADVCTQQVQRARVPIVRRSSGGGTHYVAPGNVLFSFMSPAAPIGVAHHRPMVNNQLVSSIQDVSPDGYTVQQHGVVVSYTDPMRASSFLLNPPTTAKVPLGLPASEVEALLTKTFDKGNISSQPPATLIECNTAADVWAAPNDLRRMATLYQQMKAVDFVHQDNPEFDLVAQHSFAFGRVEVHVEVCKRLIVRARIFSNSIDTLFIERLQDALLRRSIANARELASGVHAYFQLPVLLQNPHAAQQHRALVGPVVEWISRGGLL